MRNLILWLAAFAVLLIGAPLVFGARTARVVTPPPPIVLAAAIESVTPPAPPPTAPATKSPLATELEALLGTFTPSWPEHEEATHLASRREAIAKLIADACAEEFPGDAATARKYAVTLAFIGQRETRFAEKPNLLGNQDDGAAHGYWQIHEWKKMNPYAAATAVDLLRHAPASWVLPQPSPWEGLPGAAEYLRLHP